MLELNKFCENKKLADFAQKTAEVLCTDYVNKDTSVAGILSSQNGQMSYTTYGDYFFMECLARLLLDIEVCW